MFFFILLSLFTYCHACDRCTAINEYVEIAIYDDSNHIYYAEHEKGLYWYLKGRLAAWDEIKYIGVE